MSIFQMYEKSCKETKSPCDDVLNNLSEEKAKEYIKMYFEDRGKSKAFEFDYFDKDSKILNKAIHTVSTFLLGFSLKDIVYDILKEYISKENSSWKDWDFEYTWFLTSLYHDCLSGYEKNIPINNKENSLKYFLGKTERTFEYSIYNDCFYNKILDESDLPVMKPTFSEEIINNYFKYRTKEMNCIDHGIIGGYIQFDKLIKNFKEQYENASNLDKIVDGEFYTNHNERTLVWRIQHLWHFAFVADAILAHNIWYVDSSDKELVEMYRKYGLDSLIVCKEEGSVNNRIILEKSPLLFFLAIIDTIEPTKYFDTLNPQFVLENISVIYKKEAKTIEISVDKKIFNVDLWYQKKILDLKTWINIKDTVLDNNMIKIILK